MFSFQEFFTFKVEGEEGALTGTLGSSWRADPAKGGPWAGGLVSDRRLRWWQRRAAGNTGRGFARDVGPQRGCLPRRGGNPDFQTAGPDPSVPWLTVWSVMSLVLMIRGTECPDPQGIRMVQILVR